MGSLTDTFHIAAMQKNKKTPPPLLFPLCLSLQVRAALPINTFKGARRLVQVQAKQMVGLVGHGGRTSGSCHAD